MNGILIYKKDDANRNRFVIEKYCNELHIPLILMEDIDFNSNDMPQFVINRTNTPYIAKFYEERNIRVFNPFELCSLANDKRKAYDFMKEHAIEILPIDYYQTPCVEKPRNGRGGNGVKLIEKSEQIKNDKNLIYQKYASCPGKDLRVYLLGGNIVISILRQSKNDFRANMCLGGDVSIYKLSNDERDLIMKISSLLTYDFIGLDFIFDNGHIVFNEIEDTVGARSVYKLSKIDIVSLYCNYIKAKMSIK